MYKLKCKRDLSKLLSFFMFVTCMQIATTIFITEKVSADSSINIVSGQSIEANNVGSSNVRYAIEKKDGYSGGDRLSVYTGETPPAEGYRISYSLNVDEEGAYALDADVSPPNDGYTSPFNVIVNNKDEREINIKNYIMYDQFKTEVCKFHLGSVELKKGLNTLTFKLTGPRSAGDKYIFFADTLKLTKIPFGVDAITTDPDANALLNIFQSNEEVKLSINLNETVKQDTKVDYEVYDFFDKQVKAGNVIFTANTKSTNLNLGRLDKGCFKIKARTESGQSWTRGSFTIIAPLSERKQLSDSPFAIDTASRWLVKPNMLEDFTKSMKLLGISWVRDRFEWNTENPAEDAYQHGGRDEKTIDIISNNGLKIVNDYASAPAWTKKEGYKLPDDLRTAYKAAVNIADYYGDRVPVWEVWNEPEASSVSAKEGADRFSALVKACAIGYQDSKAKPKVLMGGLTSHGLTDPPQIYHENIIKNDVLSYVYAYNYHNYSGYSLSKDQEVPFFRSDMIKRSIELLKKYGFENKPVYITEGGLASAMNTAKDPWTDHKERIQARLAVLSNVLSLSLGIDKNFFFCGPPFNEVGQDFGMFNENYVPREAYAAYAALTEAMGEAKYLGSINGLNQGAEGYAFRDGNDSVAVIWADKVQNLSINMGKNIGLLTDIMGNKKTINAVNKDFNIEIGPNAVYLRIKGEMPAELITSVKPKEPMEVKPFTEVQRIVLDQRFPKASSLNSRNGYNINKDESNVMTVQVYNFNNKKMEGEIIGNIDGGWQLSPANQTVSIDPMGMKELTYTIKAGDDTNIQDKAELKFCGKFNNENTSNSVTTVIPNQYSGYVPIIKKTINIDGVIDQSLDVADSIDLSAGKRTGITDNADLSGNVWFDWDDNYFYLSAKIHDDNLSQNYSGENVWRADSIQFTVCDKTPGESSPEWFEYWICLQNQGEPFVNRFMTYSGYPKGPLKNANYKVTRDESTKTTVYELALPKSEMASIPFEKDKAISVSVLVNDSDNGGSRKYIEYGEGMAAARDSSLFVLAKTYDASYKTPKAAFIKFKDIDGHWANEIIKDMASKQIINGVGNDLFEPDRNMTRAEFVAIVVKALGMKLETDTQTDVNLGKNQETNLAWFTPYVRTAYKRGIISKDGDEFGPTVDITREEAMAIMANTMSSIGFKEDFKDGEVDKLLAGFTDADKCAAEARNSVAACIKSGIISGSSKNLIAPQEDMTRAEVAAIIQRFLKKTGLI